jgi:hypothetical protein
MLRRYTTWLALASLTTGCALSLPSAATDLREAARSLQPQPAVRITTTVEKTSTVALPGTAPLQAIAKYDLGPMQAGDTVDGITLVLKRDDDREKAFRAFLSQLNNPASPDFHHWLTAKELGERFGPSPQDVQAVQQWLQAQGMTVPNVSSDRMRIVFSGAAGAVAKAFGTSLHRYNVDGDRHFANSGATKVPAALSPVIQAVALDDFFPKAQHTPVSRSSFDRKHGKWTTATAGATANFTVPPGNTDPNTTYDMVPADFNQVYNVKPLWQRRDAVRGAGQTVVVLERTNVLPDDVARFRKAFLPADAKGSFSILHPLYDGVACDDPGLNGDEGEAALDAEWAGAAAPDADVVLASCADSGSTFGPFVAAARLLEGGPDGALPPPVWSLSYGACESLDPSDAFTADVLWSAAAAEGVTVFVSSGDGGSTQCDQGALFWSTSGAAVNGLASSPSVVAVGGTDFNDRGHLSTYWTDTNLPYYQSAIGYIPEMTWNNSCASSHLYTLLGYTDGITACNDGVGRGQDFLQVGGAGGGPSGRFAQPVEQVGIAGSTNHTARMLPDVSLFSANGIFGHALVFCMSDADNGGTACDFDNPDSVFANSAGGTSFAAPAMAGVQTLINQATDGRSGNVLPALYGIAARQYGTVGSPNTKTLTACNASNGATISPDCVFNNVTEGDIVQPCGVGSPNCDTGHKLTNIVGIVEGGDPTTNALVPAWKTNVGYSMATGLGTINASNLVDAVAAWGSPAKRDYAAPADFLSLNNLFSNDGYSDFAYVDPSEGMLHSVAMKGAVSLYDQAQAIDPSLTVAAFGDLIPGLDALSLKSGEIVLLGSDNRVNIWVSTGTGGYFTFVVNHSVPSTWKLLGTGVDDPSGDQKLVWFDTKTSQIIWWKLDLDPVTQNDIIVTALSKPIDGVRDATPVLADANGDGYTDIVWTRSSDASVTLWIADQKRGFVSRRLPDRPAGATLYGVGDIDGNGSTDLIWTDAANAQLTWWTLDGFRVVATRSRAIPDGYVLASIGDYDGDGMADLLWRNTNGRVVEWQGTGKAFAAFKVADAWGTPLVLAKQATVPANRFQGGRRVTATQ